MLIGGEKEGDSLRIREIARRMARYWQSFSTRLYILSMWLIIPRFSLMSGRPKREI